MRIRRTRGRRSHGLVRTYVWLMLVCTVLAVVPAIVLTMSKTSYESTAQVVVRPTVTQSGSVIPPDMPTEQQIAESGSVNTTAAAMLGMGVEEAVKHVKVSVPVDAAVLTFTYSADTAKAATAGARAFSLSYLRYRNFGQRQTVSHLISPASTPHKPVTPDYVLIVGAALLGGLGIGFGAAYAWDRLSGRLRSAEDVGGRTGLPVLATLPHLSRQRARAGQAADPEMGTAFSQLASRVPGLVESRKEFTLLVTGATTHAGTSTIARQTAVALARMGKRVVLVCADPSSSGLEDSFGVTPSPGLSDLLAGTTATEQALHETAVPGLTVLPPGSRDPGHAPSQSLDELQLLIWTLAADAIVVIDAPAVLSSASAALLGYVADQVILVVDLVHGSRASAREAADSLRHISEKVVGCVTNQPSRVRPHRPATPPKPATTPPEAVAPAR